ncbi:MAG: haloacid dehalogenase type II [Deltaproteobacteria bacterium]|nr:haloacid dehalogenase type II [Deltaproteobacteria bacterium]MBW1960398.1 haloacid dehalogenase type II [Deltaproteobacteria bacterium]
MERLSEVKALTFDLFGTVLDLGTSLTPAIGKFLKSKGSDVSPQDFWQQWRYRQRIEQYQDTIMMLGHSGYLETARRGLVWTLKLYGVDATGEEVREFMKNWQQLSPFPEVVPALQRLSAKFKLVALSNGEPQFLNHLARNRIRWNFDRIISVEVVGAFKPHPGIYRRAAAILELEVGECMMVSANSFDIVGARSCGFRGAFVNRYNHPYEDSPYLPDITVKDFSGLAEALL